MYYKSACVCILLIDDFLQSTGNIYNFCQVGLKISGTSPARASAVLEYEQRSMSAIQSTTTAAHTVIFLGSNDGYLIKVSNRILFYCL